MSTDEGTPTDRHDPRWRGRLSREDLPCAPLSKPMQVVEVNDPEKEPTLVWWSTVGAEQGTPWRVRHHDGTCALYRAIRITGVVDFIQPKQPIPDLPDGPRGLAVLIDGTLVAGK